MAYHDLSDFVKKLEAAGQLKRIKTEVSAELEITEITDRVSKAYGPALLFEKVKGYSSSVLINAFGSYERMALALNVKNVDEIAREIESLVKPEMPSTFIDKIKFIPQLLMTLSKFPPKTVRHASCQEIVYETAPSLARIPILKCWPGDGGQFITLPLVFTRNLKTGNRNTGMYRLHVYDEKTTGMHWHVHHDGARHFRDYQRENKRMPVAVALGCDPAITYAATAPVPPEVDEMVFAGFLRKKNVEMV
ncbi:MAG: UbiD family decarboxylase domain-containing protein, partial [Planctomycetota bacterium]